MLSLSSPIFSLVKLNIVINIVINIIFLVYINGNYIILVDGCLHEHYVIALVLTEIVVIKHILCSKYVCHD